MPVAFGLRIMLRKVRCLAHLGKNRAENKCKQKIGKIMSVEAITHPCQNDQRHLHWNVLYEREDPKDRHKGFTHFKRS